MDNYGIHMEFNDSWEGWLHKMKHGPTSLWLCKHRQYNIIGIKGLWLKREISTVLRSLLVRCK